MSKKPQHRGPAPEDTELYDPHHWPVLRGAMRDLCWLLDRDYSLTSSVELVGNHFNLTSRQRMAISRCACSAEAARRRQQRAVPTEQLAGGELWLDGFNVLMAIEVALAGGVVLIGRDGCLRDVAGVHSRYARVCETIPALRLIAAATAALGVRRCRWHFDRPVSNSGRLRSLMLDLARAEGWDWTVELVMNPDKLLAECGQIIATADSAVLDRCQRWFNLPRQIIPSQVREARLVDLWPERTDESPDCGAPTPMHRQ